ncbi:MAG TPA: serine/threonine-protein kinase, partial [Polyangia bacterium]
MSERHDVPAGVPGPGELIAGKYEVESILGVGGMGAVVAARHHGLGHSVAIKFLLPDALANAEGLARFLREARALVRLRSEHVVRVMDVDTLPGGAPYVVMERLHGQDLAQALAARGPLPPAEAVGYVLQACAAVAEAHALGIVHRDLKPANLFVTAGPDGAPLIKVLDFGISKVVDLGAGDGAGLTASSALMGTPAFMSPEQIRSARDVDGRTDIWAFGAVLYQLLGGAPPFAGDNLVAVCAAILAAEAPALGRVRPEVPPGLERVVSRCLEKDPARRYPTVAHLARALLPFAPPGCAALVARIERTAGVAPPPAAPPAAPARRRWLAGLALGGVALGAAAFWGLRPATPAGSPAPATGVRAAAPPPRAPASPLLEARVPASVPARPPDLGPAR